MFFPFVIPDSVLQCHRDAIESNIIEDCAKFLKCAPERSGGFLRTRPDNQISEPLKFSILILFFSFACKISHLNQRKTNKQRIHLYFIMKGLMNKLHLIQNQRFYLNGIVQDIVFSRCLNTTFHLHAVASYICFPLHHPCDIYFNVIVQYIVISHYLNTIFHLHVVTSYI